MNVAQIQALPHHLRLTVPDDYLDIFQHMNVQYYLKIFNDSIFEMFSDLGMTDAFFTENNVAVYAVDQRLSYKSQVKEGETIATYSRLIARSSKSLHFMHFMINETQSKLAATIEVLSFHVSKETERSAPFLPIALTRLDQQLAVHQALPWNLRLSGPIHVGF